MWFRRKWKLKRHIINLSLVLCFLIVSCAKNTSTNTPPQGANTQTPIDPGTTTPSDPYGEQIKASVPIDLSDKVNFLGLADISGSGGRPGNLSLPIVGDAKVRLQITNTRSQSIKGSLFLAFEDQQGFWGAKWDAAFPGTGFQTSNSSGKNIDIIFADDDLAVRALGVVVNQNFYGTLFYRLRQPGDTACRQVQVTCTITYPGGGTYTFSPGPGQTCPNYSIPDTVVPCQNYMNPSNAQVKRLGNFNNSFSSIATLPEAQ